MTVLATCFGLLGVAFAVLAGIAGIGMITAYRLTRTEHHNQHKEPNKEGQQADDFITH